MNSIQSAKGRLLITGGSGFLGRQLCRLALDNWKVVSLSRRPGNMPGVLEISVDITDANDLEAVFSRIRPDAVVHTAGETQPNDCEIHPGRTGAVNVSATVSIARLCMESNIPLIFTSTDLVFDGRNAPYDEVDPVNPLSVYGQQKVSAEKRSMALYPGICVCRLPLMFGVGVENGGGFAASMIRSIAVKEELKLFVDEFRTPVDTRSAAEGILKLIGNESGVIHLGGKTRISRYQMGMKFAEIMGIENPRITPVHLQEMPMPAPRPADVSLDSEKAFRSGYAPMDLEKSMVAVIGQLVTS